MTWVSDGRSRPREARSVEMMMRGDVVGARREVGVEVLVRRVVKGA